MSANFVPILASPPQAAGQQTKISNKINVLSGSSATKATVAPLVSALPRLSAASSGSTAPAATAPTAAPAVTAPSFAAMTTHAGQNHGAPKISFQKDGDRISLIRIQCPCGQVFELSCVY